MDEAMVETNLVKEETKMESIRDEETISEEIINKEDDQLKSTKEEMGEVREENERLKMELSKLMKNYESLKTHYLHIAKLEPGKTVNPTHQDEDHDLVSLTLGRQIITNLPPHKNEKKNHILMNEEEEHDDDKFVSQGLELGLDCRFEPTLNGAMVNSLSNENGGEEQNQDGDSKSLKTMRSGDDEFLQQPQLKRARVSVRARCDTPTMNDGCQWRKYGQKTAKGNPCPRAYYRCTLSPTCPVRKQAQRCANDKSILITTYEGTHNHPLPNSATAMASTTSAAASMLRSGSSSSTLQPSYDTPVNTITTTSGATSSSHGSKSMLPHFFNFANSSISTLNSHPTITLDLTSTAASQQQPILQNFNRFSSLTKYPADCLNFSSSSTTSCLESFSTKPRGNSYLSYNTPSYNRSKEASSQAQLYQGNYMQTNNRNRYQMLPTLTENTLAAATKAAITSDPNFRSAIEAAITSFVSNNGSVAKSGQNLKWGYP